LKKRNWVSYLPLPDIFRGAKYFDIDPYIVSAIVSVESRGQNYSTRFEPNYKYLYKVDEFANLLKITPETEACHQRTSWGLMHILGSTSRDIGYKGFLPALAIKAIGLKWGLTYLNSLIEKHDDIHDAISSYNQGSPRKDEFGEYLNQDYVDRVIDKAAFLKATL
jgi:hypothetical protein